MKKMVVANWKMNPATLAEAEEILSRTEEWLEGLPSEALAKEGPDIIICPPFIFLDDVAQMLQEGRLKEYASLGAQDISASDEGAQTGEVGGVQLVRIGVRYVIIGHSERRWKLDESNEVVNQKLDGALRAGLVPIVCVGERQRNEGWQEELRQQVAETFAGLERHDIQKCLIAYEPVWAISTNPGAKADTPDSAAESIDLICTTLNSQLSTLIFLYGGSITPKNAADFLSHPAFSGILVGGASVRPNDFVSILAKVT